MSLAIVTQLLLLRLLTTVHTSSACLVQRCEGVGQQAEQSTRAHPSQPTEPRNQRQGHGSVLGLDISPSFHWQPPWRKTRTVPDGMPPPRVHVWHVGSKTRVVGNMSGLGVKHTEKGG